VVARFEAENHVLEILKGYVASSSQKSMVVVGDAHIRGTMSQSYTG
jgi:hypothetical protein